LTIVLNSFLFRDRIGTVVNVVGDAFGAGIIGHLSKADLAKVPLNPPIPMFSNELGSSEHEKEEF